MSSRYYYHLRFHQGLLFGRQCERLASWRCDGTSAHIVSFGVPELICIAQAFLYCTYIVMNAVLSPALGGVIDRDFNQNGNILKSLYTVGG